MTEGRVENYVESDQERNEGHLDTRQKNFECENPDKKTWDVIRESTSPDNN